MLVIKLLIFVLPVFELQAEYLLPPAITNTTRNIAVQLTRNPGVQSTVFALSNDIATFVDYLTKTPYAVARSLGQVELPSLDINTNSIEEIDKYIAEFNIGKQNEDATLPIDALIAKYGYPVEKHGVTTDDGYQLTMFRIPSNGTAVFLMHGVLSSSDDFVVAGPGNALAYLLADQGYDVWMGNARGTKHSRRHKILKPSQASFWDFSWHEIGIYDLPAMIDYILAKRGIQSIKYVGHSQGSTVFFVMMSEKSEYNKKVAIMVALSPIAYMTHVRSPVVRLLCPGTPLLDTLTRSIGLYEFLPDNKLIRALKTLICGVGPLTLTLCTNVLFLVAGFDFKQLNVTNLPVIYGHVPSGASIKQLIHFAQEVVSQDFKQYDYGKVGNLKRYGQTSPPKYVLEKVVSPICLVHSDADWLAHPKDVKRLQKRLNNVVEVYKVTYKQFNHMDFVFAKDVKKMVYDKVLSVLASF